MYFGYSVNFMCLNIDRVICGNKPKDGSQMGYKVLFPNFVEDRAKIAIISIVPVSTQKGFCV